MSRDSLGLLVTKLMGLREQKAGLKFQLDEVTQGEKNVEDELLQVLDSKDLKSFRHKKFGLITSTERIWAKISNFEKALEFFEEQGLDQEIFQLKPQSGRLNQFVRKMLDKGKIMPEGIDFTLTRYISVRK